MKSIVPMCFCYEDLSIQDHHWLDIDSVQKRRKLPHLKKFQLTFLALSFNNKREVLKYLHSSHRFVNPYRVHYAFNLPLFSNFSFLYICWNDVHSSALLHGVVYILQVMYYKAVLPLLFPIHSISSKVHFLGCVVAVPQ